MNTRPKRFNITNIHPVICVMLQAVGVDISRTPLKPGERFICPCEHVSVLVIREGKKLPFVVIMTVNQNELLRVSFHDTDVLLRLAKRKKRGVMELPHDYSLLHALQIYLRMREAVNDYIMTHFHIRSVPEIMKGVTYLNQKGELTTIG